ncbi:hypothetical protein CDCA_CDCA06G1980 [Cyanidium caldarium]|uniref:Uncharacterized protein n=1 Tax=Cyanidium caldarium TaxID=2771 RepID=A0AAV9IUI1_CYACA|nr:hypothetical protein CDCA_CDCA06G1980 [Cyanidium caldarium]
MDRTGDECKGGRCAPHLWPTGMLCGSLRVKGQSLRRADAFVVVWNRTSTVAPFRRGYTTRKGAGQRVTQPEALAGRRLETAGRWARRQLVTASGAQLATASSLRTTSHTPNGSLGVNSPAGRARNLPDATWSTEVEAPAAAETPSTARYRIRVLRGMSSTASPMRIVEQLVPAPLQHVRADVVSASVQAVLQLLIFLGLGGWLNRISILDIPTIQSLSRAVFYIFLPALSFVSVAQELSRRSLLDVLSLPLMAAAQIGVGLALGAAFGPFFRVPPERRGLLRTACGFGNSATLPTLFLTAVFADRPGHLSQSLGYMALFCLSWSPLFWTYLMDNVGHAAPSSKRQAAPATSTNDAAMPSWTALWAERRPLAETVVLAGIYLAHRAQAAAIVVAEALTTPPAMASLVGVAIGSVRPLARLLFSESFLLSRSAVAVLRTLAGANVACAMLVLTASLAIRPRGRPKGSSSSRYAKRSMAGEGTLLTATAANSPTTMTTTAAAANVPRTAHGLAFRLRALWDALDGRLLMPIMLTRFLLLPLVSLLVLLPLAEASGLMPALATDKLLRFVILLEGCMPPAQNIVVGLQLRGDADLAAKTGRLLLAIYLLGLVPVTLLLTVFLSLLGL